MQEKGSTSEELGLMAISDFMHELDHHAFMGISPKVQKYLFGCSAKYNELKESFDDVSHKYNECYEEVASCRSSLKLLEKQKIWFQKNHLAYDEKIRVLQRDLKVATDELTYTKKLKATLESDKQELQDKLIRR